MDHPIFSPRPGWAEPPGRGPPLSPSRTIEAVRAQLGISHRVHNIPVAHEVLQRPRVDAVVGKLEAAGMAQHVRMHGQRQLGQLAGPANHFQEPFVRRG
jgi:hypothetical protein